MNRAAETWTVGAYAVRPAGEPDRCFYCGQKLGEIHLETCVIRERTVVVELRVPLVIKVGERWDEKTIESFHNSSTNCMSNIFNDLDELRDHVDETSCMCRRAVVSYLREATAEDEESQNVRVESSET